MTPHNKWFHASASSSLDNFEQVKTSVTDYLSTAETLNKHNQINTTLYKRSANGGRSAYTKGSRRHQEAKARAKAKAASKKAKSIKTAMRTKRSISTILDSKNSLDPMDFDIEADIEEFLNGAVGDVKNGDDDDGGYDRTIFDPAKPQP